jgi:hypothetical protein
MPYWNPKDHSSYDNRLRDWNVGSHYLPRIHYGADVKLPASAWQHAATAPAASKPAAAPPSPTWARSLVGGLAFLGAVAAVAWLTAEDDEAGETLPLSGSSE